MESPRNKIESKLNLNEKIKIYNEEQYEYDNEIRKNKKIFLDSSPHRQPAEKGEGVSSQNVPHIYSAGKCAVFALCVRTQIDFYITGCIVTPPNNKTRLKRFICVHIGHHARKRDRNTLKMNKYAIILL